MWQYFMGASTDAEPHIIEVCDICSLGRVSTEFTNVLKAKVTQWFGLLWFFLLPIITYYYLLFN